MSLAGTRAVHLEALQLLHDRLCLHSVFAVLHAWVVYFWPVQWEGEERHAVLDVQIGMPSWRVHCGQVHWQDVSGRADVPSMQDVSCWALAVSGMQRAELQRPDCVHAMCDDGELPECDALLPGRELREGGGQVQAVRCALRPGSIRGGVAVRQGWEEPRVHSADVLHGGILPSWFLGV